MLFQSSIVLMVALIPSAAMIRAEDWPEFRGPTGQGIAKGPLPIEWGTGKNITWSREIPGRGCSSPVLYGGRIYLSSAFRAESEDLSLRALCLNAKTGKILWEMSRTLTSTG